MNPVLSGLNGTVVTKTSDTPSAAVDVLTGDVAPVAVSDGSGFVINLEQVFAEPVLSASPLPDGEQAAPDTDSQPSAEALSAEAEQWLASVFGQLGSQLQVRETPPSVSDTPRLAEVMAHLPVPPRAQNGMAVDDQSVRQVGVQRPGPQLEMAVDATPERARNVDEAALSAFVQKTDAAPAEPGRSAVLMPSVAGVGVAPAAMAQAASAAAPVTPGERALNLAQVPQAQWGERMIGALRDSVELQFRNGLQQATIRLDPAELGRVEIQLSHESGRLQVQIQAGQADVVRLLQQTSERLRQELVGQTFVDVSVQVGADGQQERRGRQAPSSWVNEAAVQAAQASEDEGFSEKTSRSDVLITV